MSLETLINIVSTESDESAEDVLIYLIQILDEFGTNSFNDDDVKNEISTVGILLCEKLHSEGYLHVSFQYSCNNLDEETESLSYKCKYCEGVLHESMNEHEVTRIYKFSRESYNAILEFNFIMKKNRYFIPELYRNYDNLINEIDNVVPFLGSGISMPFNLPNWEGLLRRLEDFLPEEFHKKYYNELVTEGSYFEAFDLLMDKSMNVSNEDQLKEEIVQIISQAHMDIADDEHNMLDLIKLNSHYYISTNYDLIFEHFLANENGYNTPVCMDEIGNLRNISTTGNRVIHLHGHINRKSSMVVTKKDYSKLYNRKGILVQLAAILGNKSLLFIGFSFKDKFFTDIYDTLVNILKTHHYIVLFNPNLQEIRELNKKNIRVIGLKVDNDDYIDAISTLINFIVRKVN
ncbi:SIR2 family NAD-dependent protein deacylase [Paenibacillus xylanexedens]|uniref:SIR2 family NAD-dependent protein deacylase n=1 Tax=Paenibacillus xylanexedens TaxID=528191 RepID=UPI000F54C347|nr:SIR2 family protein [Paenibacillus xylanexedens]RPK27842.1 hypothetical protein EDO6_03365 [Paenibacillus xylanexedens]